MNEERLKKFINELSGLITLSLFLVPFFGAGLHFLVPTIKILPIFIGSFIIAFCSCLFLKNYVQRNDIKLDMNAQRRKESFISDYIFWIARDKSERLFAYKHKPSRGINSYQANGDLTVDEWITFEIPSTLFPEVTFENSPQEFQLVSTMDMAVIKTSLNASKINLEKADKSWERDLMLTDIDNVLSRID